jgi:hypothetical protein
MSPDPAFLQVRHDALLDASKIFTSAAAEMRDAEKAYEGADAKDTPGCFGLVSGASDELYKEYEAFYDAMQQAVATLHDTLHYASEAFVANYATYRDADWANLLDNA